MLCIKTSSSNAVVTNGCVEIHIGYGYDNLYAYIDNSIFPTYGEAVRSYRYDVTEDLRSCFLYENNEDIEMIVNAIMILVDGGLRNWRKS